MHGAPVQAGVPSPKVMPYKNKKRQKAYQKQWALNRKNQKRKWIDEYKNDRPCAHCGEILDPVCMDLHHVDPATKEGTIAALVHGSVPLEKIKEEVKKCIILCVPCHRLHHLQ